MNETVHDTVQVAQYLDASVAEVWEAYADSGMRAQWSVPAGEKLVYDEANFYEGGRDSYRCGAPESLEFHAVAEYAKILPRELIVYTETVRQDGQPLATAVVTWELESSSHGTRLTITNQVVSFVGIGMIEGNRHGHMTALQQLNRHLGSEK